MARARSIVHSFTPRGIHGLCTSLDVYGNVVSCGFFLGSHRRPHSGQAADTADIGGRTNAGRR